MMELVAIRTLMDLKVFQNLPDSGSITLDRLSKLVDAEDKLVGLSLKSPSMFYSVNRYPRQALEDGRCVSTCGTTTRFKLCVYEV